ncbi:hypothetical protein NB311A_00295 [Nitrobacter sp. Nb-311A]|uniref:hypothetical protein n=1 Tax=Nitrobacter sp. Nb-311A TaxID=314253 RepID=UPI0000684ACE|nr:hypothetical protein [Nitrobacter sp. Nb-311A]EAQ33486.1 hypothetical protein NB311A_00295 [Nitrobacter sp. Nb-311A]
MKQFVETSSKLNIDFGEKVTIGCPDNMEGKDSADGGGQNPYCGSVDKKFKGADDNKIKWNQVGETWTPTSVTLYAFSQDQIEQAASASIIQVLVQKQ